LFELALEQGMWAHREVYSGIIEMADSEEKQLQMIEDLFAIVKAQPRNKNLREPNWASHTPPLEVLYWILKKIGPLAQGNNWTVDTYLDGKRERHRLVVFKEFNGNHFKDDWFFIPVDFLPHLKKRDLPLHDLIVDVVALVTRCNAIPLWDEDGDFSEQMNDLIGGGETNNPYLDAQRTLYTEGLAAEYLRLLHRRSRQAKLDEVAEKLIAYNASSERKECMRYWLRMGIDLARSRKNLRPFSWTPDYMKNDAYVAPHQYYKFVWTYHENDAVKARAMSAMRAAAGSFPPMQISVTLPGQVVKPVHFGEYPLNLYRFMQYGWSLFLGRYREYYYKDRLNNPDPASDNLIDVFNRLEITTEI
jgi:hypothetical protein